MKTQERMVLLEGPSHFLDAVYEAIDAHVQRTGDEYQHVITGVGTEEAGDVGHEEESVLHLYVPAAVDGEEAYEQIELALDRISDEHNMEVARQNVQVTFEQEAEGGDVGTRMQRRPSAIKLSPAVAPWLKRIVAL